MSRKAQPKQRRKHYSAAKQAQRMTSNLRAWTWQGQAAIEPPPFTRAKIKMNGSWLPVSQAQQAVFYRQSMDWIVAMRALCKAPDGTEFIESVSLTIRSFKLKDMADPELNHQLVTTLLQDVKREHIVDVGWMVQTFAGDSWEPDNDVFCKWICQGLGWLSIDSPWRKRQWQQIREEFNESMEAKVA